MLKLFWSNNAVHKRKNLLLFFVLSSLNYFEIDDIYLDWIFYEQQLDKTQADSLISEHIGGIKIALQIQTLRLNTNTDILENLQFSEVEIHVERLKHI